MGVQPERESTQILAFAAANNFSITKHSNGIYYAIVDSGAGKTPTLQSTVTVKYVGKLMNGTIFSQNEYYTHLLSDVIEGWQLGLPLIKEGGKIYLIIPSTYAYGCNGKDNIPPNAVLFFDVTLLHVN